MDLRFTTRRPEQPRPCAFSHSSWPYTPDPDHQALANELRGWIMCGAEEKFETARCSRSGRTRREKRWSEYCAEHTCPFTAWIKEQNNSIRGHGFIKQMTIILKRVELDFYFVQVDVGVIFSNRIGFEAKIASVRPCPFYVRRWWRCPGYCRHFDWNLGDSRKPRVRCHTNDSDVDVLYTKADCKLCSVRICGGETITQVAWGDKIQYILHIKLSTNYAGYKREKNPPETALGEWKYQLLPSMLFFRIGLSTETPLDPTCPNVTS